MAFVVLTVWGVPSVRIPSALTRMGLDRFALRSVPGLRFAKLLGTGDGRTFTVRDADPRHWALLTVWRSAAQATAFETTGRVHSRWDDFAIERLRITMTPLSSRGRWARTEPFGSPSGTAAEGVPVASITRARLRPTRALSFWQAVPPVSAELGDAAGLRLALGIGEAPIGLQGTFSLWESAAALTDFAYRGAAHVDVVRRTRPERWYAEELFARFAVTAVTGTFNGTELALPGTPSGQAE